MTHVRQQIREQIVTLCTGLATTGTRVFDTRLYNLDPSENLPGIVISTQNESSTKSTISPSIYERELDVMIEGYAQANNNIEDTLDTISKEVEDAMGSDPTLSGKAVDSDLTSTEIEFTSMGESPIGILRLNYRVLYMTLSTNASTPQ